jgi:hypothetical protein
MTADEAFRRELGDWVRRFYFARERLAAERAVAATERLFDRERHLLTWLAGQLMLSIALLPWWGVSGVVVSLAVLYLGTMISGAWTLRREQQLTTKRPPQAVEAEAGQVVATCPPLDADARARLIRLMNLVQLRPTARSIEMIRLEVDELRATPLGEWTFVLDLARALAGPDPARAVAIHPTSRS